MRNEYGFWESFKHYYNKTEKDMDLKLPDTFKELYGYIFALFVVGLELALCMVVMCFIAPFALISKRRR